MVLRDEVSTGSGSDRVTVSAIWTVGGVETRSLTAPGTDLIIAIRG
jgi:hypothetical protein